jgi:hypothetical protein
MKLKLKEGQKAKVIKREGGHHFIIGTIVTIDELFLESEDTVDPHYKCSNKKGEYWFLIDDELELKK